ncbi:hypothetical protein [Paenibacillus sp. FSL H7-0756]|uniref:hypothetical protein n=1 Tax=Paenibacillus sp. FSL H7-0756 TaxID=2954738 RepID=UPI0030FB2B21
MNITFLKNSVIQTDTMQMTDDSLMIPRMEYMAQKNFKRFVLILAIILGHSLTIAAAA